MPLFIGNLKRDFWVLLILSISLGAANHCFAYLLPFTNLIARIWGILFAWICIIVCAGIFFKGKKEYIFSLFRRYWYAPLFFCLLTALFSIIWNVSIKLFEPLAASPFLLFGFSLLRSIIDTAFYLALAAAIANEVSYFRGLLIFIKSYKTVFAYIIIIYPIYSFYNALLNILLNSTSGLIILNIIFPFFIFYIVPSYFIFGAANVKEIFCDKPAMPLENK